MRVSCLFVTVAIMLAEQSNAIPIGSLPLVGNVAGTLHPLPVAGGLTDRLLDGEDGLLGTVTGSLRRRQSLPVVATLLAPVLNGAENMPLLGSVDSIAPVHQALPPQLGNVNTALPDVKKVTKRQSLPVAATLLAPVLNGAVNMPLLGSVDSIAPVYQGLPPQLDSANAALPDVKKVTKAAPASTASSKLTSILKRDDGVSLPEGLPSMPSVPGLDSIPGLSSMESGLSSVPVFGSMIKRDASLASLPEGLPSMPSVPGMDSIPGLSSMKSGMSSIPVLGSILKRDDDASFPEDLPSMPSVPGMDSVPGLSSMKSGLSSIPVFGSMIKRDGNLPSVPEGLPSMPSFPGMDSLPSVPGMDSFPSMPISPDSSSLPNIESLTSGGASPMSSLSGMW